MKRAKSVSKKKRLFIEELERPALAVPALAAAKCKDGKGGVTTLAIGEEGTKAV
jgi:hypothetical protein